MKRDNSVGNAQESSLRLYLWTALLLFCLVNAAGMYFVNLTPRLDASLVNAVILIIAMQSASLIFRYKKTARFAWSFTVLESIFEAMAQAILLLCSGFFFSYVGCALSSPFAYQDGVFFLMDKFIGFDWQQWMGMLNQHSTLAVMLVFIYESFIYQLFLIIIIFSFLGRRSAIYRLLLATLISSTVCILICIIVPSTAIYTYLHLGDNAYPNIPLKAAFNHVSHLNQLRAGTARSVSFGEMRGLLTFPSPHASFAVLLFWAFSSVKAMRWPMGILNLLMLISVPLVGGHYLVDAIAGVLIAVLAILIVTRLKAEHPA